MTRDAMTGDDYARSAGAQGGLRRVAWVFFGLAVFLALGLGYLALRGPVHATSPLHLGLLVPLGFFTAGFMSLAAARLGPAVDARLHANRQAGRSNRRLMLVYTFCLCGAALWLVRRDIAAGFSFRSLHETGFALALVAILGGAALSPLFLPEPAPAPERSPAEARAERRRRLLRRLGLLAVLIFAGTAWAAWVSSMRPGF